MFNNRDQMAAIQSRTPNFQVQENWWTPQYVGKPGVDLLSNNGQSSGDDEGDRMKLYEHLVSIKKFTPENALKYMGLNKVTSTKTRDPRTGIVIKDVQKQSGSD